MFRFLFFFLQHTAGKIVIACMHIGRKQWHIIQKPKKTRDSEGSRLGPGLKSTTKIWLKLKLFLAGERVTFCLVVLEAEASGVPCWGERESVCVCVRERERKRDEINLNGICAWCCSSYSNRTERGEVAIALLNSSNSARMTNFSF